MRIEISKVQAQKIKDPWEKEFALFVISANLRLYSGPSIHCSPPVRDKNGKHAKTVTHPDFEVTNPSTGQSTCVEVTGGTNHLPHKRAQRRVANRAGVENYVQISGNQIRELGSSPDPDQRLFLLFTFLGW